MIEPSEEEENAPLKSNTRYRLYGWVKTHACNGKAVLESIHLHHTALIKQNW